MTETKDPGTISGVPPVPFTPWQNSRLLISTDMVSSRSTTINVLDQGEWKAVGMIQSFQFAVDAAGAFKVLATLAKLPVGLDEPMHVRFSEGLTRTRKLLQEAGVEIV
jgi:hypothetical protein